MIPDIAVMLAVYMSARLLRSCLASETQKSPDDKASSSLANIVDVLAIVAIIYFAYNVWTIGGQVSNSVPSLSNLPR